MIFGNKPSIANCRLCLPIICGLARIFVVSYLTPQLLLAATPSYSQSLSPVPFSPWYAWWKVLCIVLMVYTVVAGFVMAVPRMPILNETIRNLYFHVPMWFAMIALFTISLVHSLRYLAKGRPGSDVLAVEAVNTGMVFGVLGIITGMLWAKNTWGAYWNGDPQQNGAAITLLVYAAYLVLRGSLTDPQQRARLSAVYGIFAYALMVPLLFILPRMTDSLHPGAGGNPGFNSYDLDSRMRAVFYPAIIGWILLGWWITTLQIRRKRLAAQLQSQPS
jgi:heme exporter protein C